MSQLSSFPRRHHETIVRGRWPLHCIDAGSALSLATRRQRKSIVVVCLVLARPIRQRGRHTSSASKVPSDTRMTQYARRSSLAACQRRAASDDRPVAGASIQ
jgi:hypothetical protein